MLDVFEVRVRVCVRKFRPGFCQVLEVFLPLGSHVPKNSTEITMRLPETEKWWALCLLSINLCPNPSNFYRFRSDIGGVNFRALSPPVCYRVQRFVQFHRNKWPVLLVRGGGLFQRFKQCVLGFLCINSQQGNSTSAPLLRDCVN